MRKILGILMATVVAASVVVPAYANCHNSSPRAYQEYMRFKGLAPATVLAESADIVAAVDDYFTTKYPQGQFPVDPSELSEAEVQAQQVQAKIDYPWLQAKLIALRERARAAGANDAADWLAYMELTVEYTPEQTVKILSEDLPTLASFSGTSAYERSKYDAVVGACAASLEKADRWQLVDSVGGPVFFEECGKVQSSSKQAEGHIQRTHVIYDNVTALKAYESDHRKWWEL